MKGARTNAFTLGERLRGGIMVGGVWLRAAIGLGAEGINRADFRTESLLRLSHARPTMPRWF